MAEINKIGIQYEITSKHQALADNREVARSVKRVGDDAERSSKQVGRLDQSLKTMGAFRWLSYAGFATVATGIGAVTNEALNFEDAMAKVRAATGAQGQGFTDLWHGTLDAAETFRATGSEAANALYQVTTGGVEAADSLKVLNSTLALAQAAEIDQGEAALLQVGIMNSFHESTKDLVDITDQLAQAAKISGINLGDVAYTMKYLEGPANIANQSLEDILETVALLGRLGMRGQNVGTGLASGLTNLATLTPEALETLGKLGKGPWFFQDVEGNLLPLQRIVEKVVELTAQVSSTERLNVLRDIFGKDSLDVWATLVNAQLENIDLVEKNREEFKKFGGTADEMAHEMNTTVKGAFERLWGAITTISTTKEMEESSRLQAWLDGITKKIQDFDLNDWLEDNEETINQFLESGEAFVTFLTEGVVPAFVGLNQALSPAMIPVLEATTAALKFMADNASTLQPLIVALTAMYVAQRFASPWGGIPGLPFPTGKNPEGLPTPKPEGNAVPKGKWWKRVLKRTPVVGRFNPWVGGFLATITAAELASAQLDQHPTWGHDADSRGRFYSARGVLTEEQRAHNQRITEMLRRPPPVQADRVRTDDFARGAMSVQQPIVVKVELDGKVLAQTVARVFENGRIRR